MLFISFPQLRFPKKKAQSKTPNTGMIFHLHRTQQSIDNEITRKVVRLSNKMLPIRKETLLPYHYYNTSYFIVKELTLVYAFCCQIPPRLSSNGCASTRFKLGTCLTKKGSSTFHDYNDIIVNATVRFVVVVAYGLSSCRNVIRSYTGKGNKVIRVRRHLRVR